jgi:hypothetical protein
MHLVCSVVVRNHALRAYSAEQCTEAAACIVGCLTRSAVDYTKRRIERLSSKDLPL